MGSKRVAWDWLLRGMEPKINSHMKVNLKFFKYPVFKFNLVFLSKEHKKIMIIFT